jgi:hypothetical protein
MDEETETGGEESIRSQLSQLLNKRFLIPAIAFALFFLYIKSAEKMFDNVIAAEQSHKLKPGKNAWSKDDFAQSGR